MRNTFTHQQPFEFKEGNRNCLSEDVREYEVTEQQQANIEMFDDGLVYADIGELKQS